MIVVNAKSPLDDARQASSGPPAIGKPVDDSALGENIGDDEQLLSTEPTGATGCPALPQRLNPFLL